MANMEFDFPDDFMKDLLETDFDEICEEALEEAAPIYKKSLQDSMKHTVQHEGDSEMIASVKVSKPKKAKTNAWIINIGPSGYSKMKKFRALDGRGVHTNRRYPVSNALKAIWKEYGIPGQQAPQPFLTNATNNAEDAVMRKLQEVYDRKVGG